MAPSVDVDRLNGWKEIAAHVGKGIRTVQRWEKEYGLPVHRIGRPDGEIVYAFRSEIAAWEHKAAQSTRLDRQTAEPDPHVDIPPTAEPPVRLRRPVALAVTVGAIVLTAAAASVLTWRFGHPSDTAIASWDVRNNVLTTYNAARERVWTYRFEVPVADSAYNEPANSDLVPGSEPIQLVDLDGNGSNELLMKVVSSDLRKSAFLGLNADGTVRFRLRPSREVRYGSDVYADPWLPYRLFTTRNSDGSAAVWAAFTHGLWFPTILVELADDGGVKQEYWSNGFISLVSEVTWQGRRRVIVGAANNEHHGASLAVFERDTVKGSAPASKADYRCEGCPPGSPSLFLVFPGACMLSPKGTADLLQSRNETRDALNVLVTHGRWRMPQDGGLWHPGIWYRIDASGRPDSAETTPEFLDVHRTLLKTGYIDHQFGPEDVRRGSIVLKWTEGRFAEVPIHLK